MKNIVLGPGKKQERGAKQKKSLPKWNLHSEERALKNKL